MEREEFTRRLTVLRLAECRSLVNLRVLDLRSSAGPLHISADAAAVLRGAPQFARTQVLP